MKPYLLEACVDSLRSALAAQRGGADRLELCGNLVIGGTTPETELFSMVREQCHIPIHVLIRPRYGDFLYNEDEYQLICRSVTHFRKLGADGLVLGCLKPDGSLNMEQMKRLIELAGGCRVTLHRAFDMCREPEQALEQAVELGCRTILTSGQKNNCLEGKELLGRLSEQAGSRIEILAGGGISPETISVLKKETSIRSFHMSGKEHLDSGMVYRKDGVSMGIPGMGEYEIFQTSEEKIRAAKKELCR